MFYVFSANASPFEPQRAYSPFSVYTLLEYGGDYDLAARSLRQTGFGGDGAFDTSFTGSTGFRSSDASPFPSSDLPTGWGRVRTSTLDGIPGDPYKMEFDAGLKLTNPESTAAFLWLYTADASSPEGVIDTPFTSGKTYRLQFEVKRLTGGGDRQTRGRLRLRLSGSERIVFELDAQRGTIDGATYITDFIVSEGTDQGLIIALEGFGPEVVISDLVAYEANTPSNSALEGITLSDYMKEISSFLPLNK